MGMRFSPNLAASINETALPFDQNVDECWIITGEGRTGAEDSMRMVGIGGEAEKMSE